MAEELMTVLEFVQSEEAGGHFDKANEIAEQLGLPEAKLNVQSALWDVVLSAVLLQMDRPEQGLPADDVLWTAHDVGGEVLLEFQKRPRAEWLAILRQGTTVRAKMLLSKMQ